MYIQTILELLLNPIVGIPVVNFAKRSMVASLVANPIVGIHECHDRCTEEAMGPWLLIPLWEFIM